MTRRIDCAGECALSNVVEYEESGGLAEINRFAVQPRFGAYRNERGMEFLAGDESGKNMNS